MNPAREAYFPSIEKKYGREISYWLNILAKQKESNYREKIAYLRDNYGFTKTHANALVMYSRGSRSSKRFTTLNEYYASIPKIQAGTIKRICKAISSKYPELDLVIAWNQPNFKLGKNYIFGISSTNKHILIAPWDQEVLKKFSDKFKEGNALKKTIQLPIDWEVDDKLLQAIVKARIKNLKAH